MKLFSITAFAFSVASSVMISPAAFAGYTCSTDYFGNTTCSGTVNGQRINTTTSTDYFTKGTIQRITFWKTPFVDSKLEKLSS